MSDTPTRMIFFPVFMDDISPLNKIPVVLLQKQSTSYAIAVFDGNRAFRGIERYQEAGLQVCSLVACTKYGSKDSCGVFNNEDIDINERETTFKQVDLKLVTENAGQMSWATTLGINMLPYDVNEFEYNE